MSKKKGFFKRWGEGMKNFTSLQIVEHEIVGHITNTIGVLGGTFYLIYKQQYFFAAIIMFGGGLICYFALVSSFQKYVGIKNYELEIQKEVNDNGTK